MQLPKKHQSFSPWLASVRLAANERKFCGLVARAHMGINNVNSQEDAIQNFCFSGDGELCGWNVVGVTYKIMICPNLLTSGGFILAADYCQLELRILAHFSHDCRLIEAFNKGADVFKSIAAEWKMIDSEAVGDSTRQQAKQVYFKKKNNHQLSGQKGVVFKTLGVTVI